MRLMKLIGYVSLGLTILGAISDFKDAGDATPEDRAAAVAVAADLLGDDPPPADTTKPSGPKPETLRHQISSLFGQP